MREKVATKRMHFIYNIAQSYKVLTQATNTKCCTKAAILLLSLLKNNKDQMIIVKSPQKRALSRQIHKRTGVGPAKQNR